MSGILTTGILSSIANPAAIPYIQTIQQSPEGSKMIGDKITADTLLQVNAQKQTIKDSATTAIDTAPISEAAKNEQKSTFLKQQGEFGDQVIAAFTKSLHTIFIISSILMVIALAFASFIKEKKLRDTPHL